MAGKQTGDLRGKMAGKQTGDLRRGLLLFPLLLLAPLPPLPVPDHLLLLLLCHMLKGQPT